MTSILYFCLIPLFALILIAQLLYMPMNLCGVWGIMLVTMVWRYYKEKITPISKWLLIIFVFMSLTCIYLEFKSFLGVEAGVALLSTCLFAKCLESKNVRDLLIVFNFGLFVSASLFLHSQSLFMTCMILGCLICCFVGLYRIQTVPSLTQYKTKISLKSDIQHVTRFLAIALPFFIILFLFFPRLPPLWSVPITSDQSMTGMSDRMSPGDIARLSQSSALTFRITGNLKQFPERQNMYWRAMVLDDYDGRVWTNNSINQIPASYPINPFNKVTYQYLPADLRQPWIMSLEQSFPDDQLYQAYADGSIKALRVLQQNQPVRLSWIGTASTTYTPVYKQQILEASQINFPVQRKTQELAQQLWLESHQQPERYIQNVLKWYRQQGFIYTLSPDLLSGDRTDQFLFETRKGFCEHYASSFVVLMRYAGVPARVVIGYQGGQLAPDAKSWEVRQLDAHAWAEVYLKGHWQRVDPTAAIAPRRVDEGMQQYLQQDKRIWGQQAGTYWKQQNFNLIKNIRVWSDYATYQWQSKVIGYDVERQKKLLAKLGFFSAYSYVLFMIIAIILLIAPYPLWLWYQNKHKLSPIDRSIAAFQKKLPTELKKQTSETFKVWMLRLSKDTHNPHVFYETFLLHEKIVFFEQYIDQDAKKFSQLLKDCAYEIKHVEKTCHPVKN